MKFSNIFIILFLPLLISGQASKDTRISIGYHGDVIFSPGVKLRLERPITQWSKEKKGRTKTKSINYGADLIYYHNKGHHHALIFSPSISIRREKQNGKFLQFSVASGIHRSKVAGTTYNLSSEEEIKVKNWAGQTTSYSSISIVFGKSLKNGIGYYSEVGLYGRYPYNNAVLPGLFVSLGFQFSLNQKN